MIFSFVSFGETVKKLIGIHLADYSQIMVNHSAPNEIYSPCTDSSFRYICQAAANSTGLSRSSAFVASGRLSEIICNLISFLKMQGHKNAPIDVYNRIVGIFTAVINRTLPAKPELVSVIESLSIVQPFSM